ncbi:MAG: phage holin family protein [Chlorobiaceae bacterium]|nr:phage holin family protein [Chlorobiaceae bacterium]
MFGKKKEHREESPERIVERPRKGIPALIDATVTSTYKDIMAIVEAKLELLKIELTEKVALASALLILAVLFLIGTAYMVTSLALLTGELLGHAWLGYLVVSLLFLGGFLFFTKIRPDALKDFIHKIILTANDYRK